MLKKLPRPSGRGFNIKNNLGFSQKRFKMWLKPILFQVICPRRKRRGY